MQLVKLFGVFVISLLLGIIATTYFSNDNIDSYQRYKVISNKNFSNTMFDLNSAIRDHNYRITSINRIGEAIINDDKEDFIEVNIINFCNVAIAKQLIQISTDYILYMPCRVVVYEKLDKVIVETYLLNKQDDLHNKINNIVKDIVDSAAK